MGVEALGQHSTFHHITATAQYNAVSINEWVAPAQRLVVIELQAALDSAVETLTLEL